MFQFMVFNNPAWDYKTLNFDSDMALRGQLEKRQHQRDGPEPQAVRRAAAGS